MPLTHRANPRRPHIHATNKNRCNRCPVREDLFRGLFCASFTLKAPPFISPCARRCRKPRAAGTNCTSRRPACMAKRKAFVRRGGSMPNFVVIVTWRGGISRSFPTSLGFPVSIVAGNVKVTHSGIKRCPEHVKRFLLANARKGAATKSNDGYLDGYARYSDHSHAFPLCVAVCPVPPVLNLGGS